MIDELGAEARALLAAARDGMSPDAAAVRRVRAGVSAATGAAAAGTAIGVKLGVVAIVAAIAGGVGLYAMRGATAVAPTLELASPAELPVQAAVREPPAAAAVREPAPASSDDELITIEAPVAPRDVPAGPRPAASERAPAAPKHGAAPDPGATAAAAPAVSAGGDSRRGSPAALPERGDSRRGSQAAPPERGESRGLAREVELVDLAMVALRRGDAGTALAAVRRHAVETGGRGQLAEDAAAIEVEALCRLHDPTTHARLEAFDARFPRSAQRSRLTNRCP